MPKFVIEREVPGASKLSEDEIREASLKSLEALRRIGPGDSMAPQLHHRRQELLHLLRTGREHDREHGRFAGLPVDRVAAVRRLIDSANFE